MAVLNRRKREATRFTRTRHSGGPLVSAAGGLRSVGLWQEILMANKKPDDLERSKTLQGTELDGSTPDGRFVLVPIMDRQALHLICRRSDRHWPVWHPVVVEDFQ